MQKSLQTEDAPTITNGQQQMPPAEIVNIALAFVKASSAIALLLSCDE